MLFKNISKVFNEYLGYVFGQHSFQVWILFIQVLQDPSIQSTWPDNALSCSVNTTRVYRQIIKLLAAFATFPFSNNVLFFLLWIFLSVKWCPLKQNKNIMKDPTGYVLIFLLQGWIHWPHTCMYGLLHKVLMLHSNNWRNHPNATINQNPILSIVMNSLWQDSRVSLHRMGQNWKAWWVSQYET